MRQPDHTYPREIIPSQAVYRIRGDELDALVKLWLNDNGISHDNRRVTFALHSRDSGQDEHLAIVVK